MKIKCLLIMALLCFSYSATTIGAAAAGAGNDAKAKFVSDVIGKFKKQYTCFTPDDFKRIQEQGERDYEGLQEVSKDMLTLPIKLMVGRIEGEKLQELEVKLQAFESPNTQVSKQELKDCFCMAVEIHRIDFVKRLIAINKNKKIVMPREFIMHLLDLHDGLIDLVPLLSHFLNFDLNEKDAQGTTVLLEYFKKSSHKDLGVIEKLHRLVAYGANPVVCNDQGDSIQQCAMQDREDAKLVANLVESYINKEFRLPLQQPQPEPKAPKQFKVTTKAKSTRNNYKLKNLINACNVHTKQEAFSGPVISGPVSEPAHDAQEEKVDQEPLVTIVPDHDTAAIRAAAQKRKKDNRIKRKEEERMQQEEQEKRIVALIIDNGRGMQEAQEQELMEQAELERKEELHNKAVRASIFKAEEQFKTKLAERQKKLELERQKQQEIGQQQKTQAAQQKLGAARAKLVAQQQQLQVSRHMPAGPNDWYCAGVNAMVSKNARQGVHAPNLMENDIDAQFQKYLGFISKATERIEDALDDVEFLISEGASVQKRFADGTCPFDYVLMYQANTGDGSLRALFESYQAASLKGLDVEGECRVAQLIDSYNATLARSQADANYYKALLHHQWHMAPVHPNLQSVPHK